MPTSNGTFSNGFSDMHLCDELDFCGTYDKVWTPAFVVFHWFISSLMFVLLFTTIFINGIFILSMYLHQNLHNSCNYFFLNLSVINVSLGTVGLLMGCIFLLKIFDCSETTCIFKNIHIYCTGVSMALTMTSLTVISIERYINIFHGLRCTEIITKKRVVIVISMMWVFWGGGSTTLRAFGLWWIHSRMYLSMFVINTLICAVINLRILKEVQRHENRISSQEQATANPEEQRKTREKKRARALMWIVSLVVICYIPTIIMIALSSNPSFDRTHLIIGWSICRVMYQSHSTFDILIYGIKTEEVRTSCKKIFNSLRSYVG